HLLFSIHFLIGYIPSLPHYLSYWYPFPLLFNPQCTHSSRLLIISFTTYSKSHFRNDSVRPENLPLVVKISMASNGYGGMETIPYKCLMGSVHVQTMTRFIIFYHLIFGVIVSLIAFPFFIWVGILTLIVFTSSLFALKRRSSALLLPFVVLLYLTLVLLLFLGGFIFFANIFFNKSSSQVFQSEFDTESLFFMDTERFAVILHLLNILLLLFHMWHLSVLSSCRKFLDCGRLSIYESQLNTLNCQRRSTEQILL
ncbi:hypothetical protein PENTCL1PPCAC_17851, partial [Pristionchus entomophagus]